MNLSQSVKPYRDKRNANIAQEWTTLTGPKMERYFTLARKHKVSVGTIMSIIRRYEKRMLG